jgi:hypothetical protein
MTVSGSELAIALSVILVFLQIVREIMAIRREEDEDDD